ncbi:MAG: hypothetical protein MJ229_06725 [bacterium]|nr:hypothetical protein [bacterium]
MSELIIATNETNWLEKIKQEENVLIDSLVNVELNYDQVGDVEKLANKEKIPELKNPEGLTLLTIQEFFNKNDKLHPKNLSELENLTGKMELDPSFYLKCAPSFKNQIEEIKDVRCVLNWIDKLNESKHWHDENIDDLLIKSSEIVLKKSGGLFKNYSTEVTETFSKILEASVKNCSPKFIKVFHAVINDQLLNEKYSAEKKKLTEGDRKKLYNECLRYIEQGIEYAKKEQIYSAFLDGKYQICALIKELGKDVNEFQQANLDDIIDKLFDLYFGLLENVNGLSKTDKNTIFKTIIPLDQSGKREQLIDKFLSGSNSGSIEDKLPFAWISTILNSYITETQENINAKIKCVQIMSKYLKDVNDFAVEAKLAFETSLTNSQQFLRVNEKIMDEVISVYCDSSTSAEAKENCFDLLRFAFFNNFAMVSNYLNLQKILTIFTDNFESNKTAEMQKIIVNFLGSNVKISDKKAYLDYVENNYESFTELQKKAVKEILKDSLAATNDEALIDEINDTVVEHFFKDKLKEYKSDNAFVCQLDGKNMLPTLNKVISIALQNECSESEKSSIKELLMTEIKHSDISAMERFDLCKLYQKGQVAKGNVSGKKEFILFSLELMKELSVES